MSWIHKSAQNLLDIKMIIKSKENRCNQRMCPTDDKRNEYICSYSIINFNISELFILLTCTCASRITKRAVQEQKNDTTCRMEGSWLSRMNNWNCQTYKKIITSYISIMDDTKYSLHLMSSNLLCCSKIDRYLFIEYQWFLSSLVHKRM